MSRSSNNPCRTGPAAGDHVSLAPPQRNRLVIVGASVRSVAESAARAGHEVHAADLFGDVDLRAVVASWTCPRPYPAGLPDAVATLPAGPCVYTGAIENHPDVLAAIARHRPVAGCSPERITAVRDHAMLAAAVTAAGLAFPETRADPAGVPRDGSWLLKPRRSAGGHGIAPWRGGRAETNPEAAAGAGVVWQRRVRGRAAAAAYLVTADGSRLVGLSRQLVGRGWCHARPFSYCGSIDLDPAAVPARLSGQFERLGGLLAERFGLVGFVGVDLVIDRAGRLWVIEVNPRPTAALELVERASGLSIAAAHLAACGLGPQPGERPRVGSWGKAILFAAHDVVVDETMLATLAGAAGGPAGGWPLVADIPRPPQVIAVGRPVCTLFAHGPAPQAALGRLRRRTGAVAAALRGLSPPCAAAPGPLPRGTA
jgi:predicted ATP-grasp superfamily ATP-dependent carboligase